MVRLRYLQMRKIMDDIYHGYNCGDNCPICYPLPKVTVRIGRRVFFPELQRFICVESAGGDQVRVIVEPVNLTFEGETD